ncbi:MAG: ROK family protein, partial [Chloroflexi bacterium]|nr:ROK family protein [Chloroflexota bacterium]
MSLLYAAIDLGGTKIAGALADADGHICGERRLPTRAEEGAPAVLARIAALV